ncbi:diacylglycerol/lipid kinase family protein [Brevirhabdus sp.]|uniref:diacylglycerol/lipid kinase family protein n=1 Tax=Brevirhabdus sp. TaxID=2004514 RepID=UPI004058DD10
MSMADICIIMNAGSGKGSEKLDRDGLKALCDAHPGRFDLSLFQPGEDVGAVTRKALDKGYSTIVAAGGDGTICGVADTLRGQKARLGVLPLGTFNYFARSFGIPEDPEQALKVIAAGHGRVVRVGLVNDRVFLNNASLGAYASILATREGVYKRWGRSRIAAYWSVILTLARFRTPLSIRITLDGQGRKFKSPLVFVLNNQFQLDQLGLGGTQCVAEGKFAILVAPDCGRLGLIRRALSLAGHRLDPDSDFELLCGRDVVIETRRKRRLVARDGERDVMRNPFHFRVLDDALQVIVPESGATRSDPAPSGVRGAEGNTERNPDRGGAAHA